MSDDPNLANPQEHEEEEHKKDKTALELCFITAVGLIVLAAFGVSLTYDFVSARTPIVVMTPLLILIGLQIKRALGMAQHASVSTEVMQALKGRNRTFNAVFGFLGWMLLLLGLIFVTGHVAGIAIFMFILLYLVSEEELILSVSVTAVVTLLIYLLFEFIFNIELYRGLIYRIWAGYDIF